MAVVTPEYVIPLVAFLILDKLLEPIDHVRFAAVCKEWRYLAEQHYNHSTLRWRRQVLPMLMIIPTSSTNGPTKKRGLLYSVSERKHYDNIQLPIPSVSPWKKKHCCGCGHGWLAKVVLLRIKDTIPRIRCRITLHNPFIKSVPICLPLLEDRIFHPQCCVKVILSADPTLNPDNYVVIALWNDTLDIAFIKAGQPNWTWIKLVQYCKFSNAIFYKGQIYAIDNDSGLILSFNIKSKRQEPKIQPTELQSCAQPYLVESKKGDLLLVRKFFKMNGSFFRVYKLVLDNKDGSIVQQVEVKNIGDEALFVGDHSHSVSVYASNFFGCQPNSIYYTDYSSNFPLERDYMGNFNLEDKTNTQLYSKKYSWGENMQPAFWITPLFNGRL